MQVFSAKVLATSAVAFITPSTRVPDGLPGRRIAPEAHSLLFYGCDDIFLDFLITFCLQTLKLKQEDVVNICSY